MTDAKITPQRRDAIFRRDFLAFSQRAFAELFPSVEFSREWFHEAIAAVLPYGRNQKVRRIINAPPRSLKSFMASVAWPAFMLGRDSSYKMICASYSKDLATTHSDQCRTLMESDWYRRLFANTQLKIINASE